MACGTPVVASDVGGIAEVLPPFAGLLVPPRNVEALQAALASALRTDWDTDRIVRHASGFDWDRNVARLGALLQEAALAGRQPS
jgi:glycosyltransferase involved in cell wall biosynthesis